MNSQVKELSRVARQLAPDERAALVDEIMDSLLPVTPDIDRKWLKESVDRLEAYRRGEMAAADLASVLDRLERS